MHRPRASHLAYSQESWRYVGRNLLSEFDERVCAEVAEGSLPLVVLTG